MNKRLLLAFVLLVSINLGSMAQLLPIKNVPSPEIAGLGELKCTPEVRQIITDIPRMSYAFGTLLYYQAKNAISPEYEHQRNRERKSKEELDRNQANIAKSIDTNVSGMMPNGDPAPKRKPKGWRGTILKIDLVSAMIEDYYNNTRKVFEDSQKNVSHDSEIQNVSDEEHNAYDIFEPIKNKLDDVFWKNW